MLTRTFLLVLFLLSLNTDLYAQDDSTCPLPPRLTVGGQARVLPGLPNRIRVRPSLHGTQLNEIPAGGIFTVLDGPVCADGYHWWSIDYKGNTGWTAEGEDSTYWLEPLIPITAKNAHLLTPYVRLGRGSFTSGVKWSPDGNAIAVGGSLGVWLFDANNFTSMPRLLEGHREIVYDVAFSPNGTTLASVGCAKFDVQHLCVAGEIFFWDVVTDAAGESQQDEL